MYCLILVCFFQFIDFPQRTGPLPKQNSIKYVWVMQLHIPAHLINDLNCSTMIWIPLITRHFILLCAFKWHFANIKPWQHEKNAFFAVCAHGCVTWPDNLQCISAFTTAELLSMTLHGGVRGLPESIFSVFYHPPLRLWLQTPLWMNEWMSEWSFNHLWASSSSSSSSASHSPSSLSSTSRAGGQSGEREPRRRATADGRPAATCPQHAHPGQVRRGRLHGWTHGRGQLRRRGQHWVRPAAEIPVHETSVSWTVSGWDWVLRGPHSAAHPHPEGNQEITVGHWIRWVSNPRTAALKAALVVYQALSVWDLVV